jgi:hypothetical protein
VTEPVAPDLAEAIEAWRAWRVVQRGTSYLLRSVLKPTIWPQHEPLAAECLHSEPWPRRVWRRPDGRHEAPHFRCDCGIYAADLARVDQYLTPSPLEPTVGRVLGRVSLWGTVIECERGFRASFAYPRVIYIPGDAARTDRRLDELAAALAEYGVPVEVLAEGCAEATRVLARQAVG